VNHLDGLLSAIHAEPDSDERRLIFADWLMDQGDSRGELMRLQVLRARLPVGDPRWIDLDRQEWKLLNRDARLWLGPLYPATLSWQYVRGLLRLEVEAETFLAQPVQSEEERQAYCWVEELTFRRLTPKHAAKLVNFAHLLPYLRLLNVRQNEIGGDASVASVAGTLARSPLARAVKFI
jgi:uncharacterized protein (TIGR02996 family)